MAWVDSEQMWRLQLKKRSLSTASDSEDPNSPKSDIDDISPGSSETSLPPEKSLKATRVEQSTSLPSKID